MISSTCHLANIKAIPSSLNFKWLPLSKLQRRVVTHEESTAGDLLLASLQVISKLFNSFGNSRSSWYEKDRHVAAAQCRYFLNGNRIHLKWVNRSDHIIIYQTSWLCVTYWTIDECQFDVNGWLLTSRFNANVVDFLFDYRNKLTSYKSVTNPCRADSTWAIWKWRVRLIWFACWCPRTRLIYYRTPKFETILGSLGRWNGSMAILRETNKSNFD